MSISTLFHRISFIIFIGIFALLGFTGKVQFANSQEISSQDEKNVKVEKNAHFGEKKSDRSSGGRLENFNVEEYSEDGTKKWEVKADTAKVYGKIVDLTDVEGVSYGKKSTVKVKAKKGKYNKVSQHLQLNNDVVTTTSDGIRMVTEKLNWLVPEKKAYTNEQVLVKNDKIKISGEGAKAKPDLEKIKFDRNVVTNVSPNTVIVCKGPLNVNYESNTAIFKKEVVVKDKRGKIWADKITVYFSDKKEIKRIVAEGNVKVKRGKNITRSKKAEYLRKENKVIFTGSPKLIIYPEEENKKKDS